MNQPSPESMVGTTVPMTSPPAFIAIFGIDGATSVLDSAGVGADQVVRALRALADAIEEDPIPDGIQEFTVMGG